MPNIIIIEKLGNITSSSLKSFSNEDLHKKAGFKSSNGFECQHVWKLDNGKTITLYGKQKNGRANQENKYEFPPPVDKILFFGNCLLICKNNNNEIIDLSIKDWETTYNYLYGGFHDIDDEDDDDEDDEDEDEDDDIVQNKTKSGYIKDDFIVDDNEEDVFDDEDDDEDDDDYQKEDIINKKRDKRDKNIIEEDLYLDCTSELSEDEYV